MSSLSSFNQIDRRRGVPLVVLATLLWGSTFAVLKMQLATDVRPSTLIVGRFAVAAVVLSPWLRGGRKLWAASAELGVLLWAGYATQTIGLRYTGVGRSAFLTSAGVVLVPVYTRLTGRPVGRLVWPAAAVALAGVALLGRDTIAGPLNRGDAWTLACTVVWAAYICRLERYAAALPSTALVAGHLLVVAAISVVWAAADGTLAMPGAGYPWAAVLYLGLFTTALTTWLQTVGQRYLPAAEAAVLFTLEPVFASAFGWWLLADRLGGRGLVGAGLILSAAAMAQVPDRRVNHGDTEARRRGAES